MTPSATVRLGAALLAAGLLALPAVPRASSPGQDFTEVVWTSGTTAWAAGYDRLDALVLLRSTDAGRTWQPTTPPGVRFDPLDPVAPALVFPSSQEAWVAWLAGTSRATLVVARTTDGGRNWRRVAVPVPPSFRGGSVGALAAVGRRYGWLFLLSPGVDGDQAKAVLRTSDGGARWRLVAADAGNPGPTAGASLLPEEGALRVTVLGPDVAWVGLDRFLAAGTAVRLEQSTDGGRSFHAVVLPVPPALVGDGTRAYAPVFAGEEGTLLVGFQRRGGGHPYVVSYETEDGGVSWRIGGVLPGAYAGFASFGPERLWLMTTPGPRFWRSEDGGRSWTPLPRPVPGDGYEVASWQMTGPATGFLLLRRPSLLDPAQGSALLLHTTDGGQRWQLWPLP